MPMSTEGAIADMVALRATYSPATDLPGERNGCGCIESRSLGHGNSPLITVTH